MLRNRKNSGGLNDIGEILEEKPHGIAHIKGSCEYPTIQGCVLFYQTECGVLVAVEVCGLPTEKGSCDNPVFGFHIHSGACCSGDEKDHFAAAMSHYNPCDCKHPHHAGDLPPLFGNNGYALQIFLTDRFSVKEIIGRTVIVHSQPDDFTTQPSGNSGAKIACGEIEYIC